MNKNFFALFRQIWPKKQTNKIRQLIPGNEVKSSQNVLHYMQNSCL